MRPIIKNFYLNLCNVHNNETKQNNCIKTFTLILCGRNILQLKKEYITY